MNKKILWVGLVVFLLIGVAAVGVFLFSKPASFRGTTYAEPYPVAADFQLARADGTSFKLSDLRGKVVLLFFGYTSCPDVCPITMGQLKQAVDELGDEANQVEVLFVTVDPNRDTPQRVQEYVNHFSPSFIGLSGSEADLTKVWNDFGIFREMPGDTSGNYEVGHTARVTVIDQRGNMRLSYPFDTPAENIVHDLKLLLKQQN